MQKPENQILVIFGASGDLTRRKLIPALYHLFLQDLLPDEFVILGTGRKIFSVDAFRIHMRESLDSVQQHEREASKAMRDPFIKRIHYLPLATGDAAAYAALKEKLGTLSEEYKIPLRTIFYLATPPSLYGTIARSLAGQDLHSNDRDWKRIIVEKPFGYDLASSRELNALFRSVFDEDQIYRIDHYLGKETVQNIMVTRFTNGIFEPVWNRNYIHHIEITAAESIGIGDRGGYYDRSGALRDMIQNHMLQLVALVAMEPPVLADSGSIRNEVVKVLESLRPVDLQNKEKEVTRAQYLASTIKGEKTNAYRSEKGVDSGSRTETYVALKFYIDNWRWNGVPFYVRTGKRMPTRVTEIVIHFQPAPHHLFINKNQDVSNNQLVIRIQPDEGLLLKFGMKVPGAGYQVQTVNMDFHYSDLADTYLPAAYERLLLDCMLGDPTLYARGDAVECAWKFVDPILKYWKDHPEHPLYGYPGGTWGPPEANAMFENEKTTWRFPSKNLTDDGYYCEL